MWLLAALFAPAVTASRARLFAPVTAPALAPDAAQLLARSGGPAVLPLSVQLPARAAPPPRAAPSGAVAALAGGMLGVAAVVVHSRCSQPRASMPGDSASFDRRSVLSGLLGAAALASPLGASAKVESVNPANNYYFPMAKYRYLPRIFRAWVAVDSLAPAALEVGDWEGLQEVWRRADDAVTALPLYTNAVEGSRSTKRKKKSDTQKKMTAALKSYTKDLAELEKVVEKKNKEKTKALLASARASLLEYRQLAQIDTEDGGVITLPLGSAEEAGHAGAPLGYVIPAFRGGGVSMDYALRAGEPPMMVNGQITKEYRDRFQK